MNSIPRDSIDELLDYNCHMMIKRENRVKRINRFSFNREADLETTSDNIFGNKNPIHIVDLYQNNEKEKPKSKKLNFLKRISSYFKKK